MFKFIYELFIEKKKGFIIGALGGGISTGSFLFLDVPSGNALILAYMLKVVGTVLVTAITGVVGGLIQDLYEYKIQPKWRKTLKNKDDGKQEEADKKAS